METGLPFAFQQETRKLMGEQLWKVLSDNIDEPPVTSVRLNMPKCGNLRIVTTVAHSPVAWCRNSYYVEKRPNFTLDPLMHAGAYYVQEASSMFVEYCLDYALETLRKDGLESPSLVLDLCAAPGGKSLILRDTLPASCLLFSNEPIRQRANILAENIIKHGNPDVVVTNNYAKDYVNAGLMFDIILCDVPCSGEGMFRKDEKARTEWSLENVSRCQKLQREILGDIWKCLRPGGMLIYSTCTFNALENEDNIEWIAKELGGDVMNLDVPREWNVTGSLKGSHPSYRFIPGVSKGEGLFMAVIKKSGIISDVKQPLTISKGKKSRKKSKDMKKGGASIGTGLNSCKEWLSNPECYDTRTIKDEIIAIRKEWADIYDYLSDKLSIIRFGTSLATIKGGKTKPSHSLAMSRCMDMQAFPSVEIDIEQATEYLRKESLTLSPDIPKGYVTLKFNGIPIGFVNNLGVRANNLYPQEWRIKTTHVSEPTSILK